MWWHKLHNHDSVSPLSRKRDRVSKPNPMSVPANCSDTEGMDKLFSDTVTSATAVTGQKKTLDVPIAQAAKMLGISERTVWRKIYRGELKSRTRNNKRLVRIPVFEPSASVSSDGHTTITDTPPNANAVVDLNILLRELQGANYRIGYLEAENQKYQDQVKLLPDLQAQAVKAQEQAAQVAKLEAELSALRATWWYRFWSWFTGR